MVYDTESFNEVITARTDALPKIRATIAAIKHKPANVDLNELIEVSNRSVWLALDATEVNILVTPKNSSEPKIIGLHCCSDADAGLDGDDDEGDRDDEDEWDEALELLNTAFKEYVALVNLTPSTMPTTIRSRHQLSLKDK